MSPHPKQSGHLLVILWRDKRGATFQVHRLLLEAFVGPCPKGMECCHGDGDPRNNRLDNLRWDTPQANHADRVKHGWNNRGERNNMAKLAASQVAEIRDRLAAGEVGQRLAEEFGVSGEAVSSIKRGKRWRHLEAV